MLDLSESFNRSALAERIKADIEAYSAEALNDGHRAHLGASEIGHECDRYLWLKFRWVYKEKFEGRMLRLFQRGQLEEARLVRWLRGIGCEVWEVDSITGKQFRVSAVNGHFGGSKDGKSVLPERYDYSKPLLLEFKTMNAKAFAKVRAEKLALAQPKHFSQMCAYSKDEKIEYALYIAVSKNDDDIYVEIVKMDWRQADQLERKAETIIYAKEPPARISETPSYYTCKYCGLHPVCWGNAPVEINCRSCKKCEPVEGAKFRCSLYNMLIPDDFIAKGCDRHESVL